MSGSALRQRAQNGNGGSDPGTEVVPRQGGGIGGFLADLQPQLQRALPRHLNADRMTRLALTEVRKNPALAESTPASFAGALLTAAALGLEVGAEHDAYLVPYEHKRGKLAGQVECQLIVKYTGLAKLFWQHPLAASLDAQAVYDGDDFDYAYGTAKFLRHRPKLEGRGTKVIAYYAVAELTTGASHFVVMSPDQVKKLRGGKVGTSGNIDDPERWMERKTVLRQCLKTMPKATTLNTAIDVEERGGAELYADRVAEHESAAALDQAKQSAVGPGDPITPDQRTKLHATLADAGITDRDDKLAYIASVIDRTVTSSNELTKAEASQVIEDAAKFGSQKGQGQGQGQGEEPPPDNAGDYDPTTDPDWGTR